MTGQQPQVAGHQFSLKEMPGRRELQQRTIVGVQRCLGIEFESPGSVEELQPQKRLGKEQPDLEESPAKDRRRIIGFEKV